jgi:hypothetical protein
MHSLSFNAKKGLIEFRPFFADDGGIIGRCSERSF